MKILHILDHYKPHFSGYVFRTNYILRHQRELGLEPVIVTSPKHGKVSMPVEEIDGIRVYRTTHTRFGNTPFLREQRLMNVLQKRIEEVIEKERPHIIHAHSPSLNGMPALKAGRKYGIPVVYEVRALWEDAAVDHRTFQEGSAKYKISRFFETKLFRKVDALFTICDGLKGEIIARGIPAEKITVIPNCVETDIFLPCSCDEEIAKKYGLNNLTIGFIGSFYHYEGLDLLIDAFQKMIQGKNNAKLILVGDGPEKGVLQDKINKMGLIDTVIFTGKVPHAEVNKYYSVMDILVYPRKRMRLTDLVTPLKPLEAMAMGKIVVGSDVGGIRELITHDKDGFLFKAGDVAELSELLSELSSGSKDFNLISTVAVETVRKKHNWGTAVEKYLPVYERLLYKI